MNVGAVSAGFDIGKFLLNGLRFVEFGPIKKVASLAAKPMFMSMQRKEGESEDAFKARMLHKNKSGWQTFVDSFGWGDATTAGGMVLWILSKIFGSRSSGVEGAPVQESAFWSWVGFGAKFLTFLGTPLAAIGRLKCFHFDAFLPPEIARGLKISKMEQDTPFVRDFDVERNFAKYLRYDEDLWQEIRGMHEGNKFGFVQSFMTGPPGTGKTEGARMICKNIKDAAAANGQKVEIKEVNVAQVMKAIDVTAEQEGMAGEGLEMLGARGAAKVFKEDPIQMMETVLTSVEDEINNGRNRKKEDGGPVRVIFVLDEVDQAFQMDRLNELARQNKLDFGRLRILLKRLQRLLDDNFGDVIMISNEDVDYFDQLPTRADASQERAGFLNRIKTKRLYVGVPSKETQGRIMATYLLDVASGKKLEEVFEPSIIDGIRENIPVILERKHLDPNTVIDLNSDAPLARIVVEEALGQFMHDKFTQNSHLYGRFTGRQFQEVINVKLRGDYKVRCKEHEKGTRPNKPFVNLSQIDTFMTRMLQNFEKDDRENIILRQDVMAETIIRKHFERKDTYEKLLENVQRAQSQPPKAGNKKSFCEQLAEQFTGVYRCQKVDGSYVFLPNNITDSIEVSGERYSYYHRLRLVNPDDKGQDLSDPNNWVVETFYYKLKSGSNITDIDAHIKAISNETVYTTPQTGSNFLEGIKKLFKAIHSNALLGKLGALKPIAQLFQRALEQKGIKVDEEGFMDLLGGAFGIA